MEIKVYGTTFNMRSYADDDNTYTTLETGSISLKKLGHKSAEIHLSPGHQAIFNKNDSTLTMATVNPEVITGWRHGRFVFEGQSLRSIMQDLARWYDFKFEFTDPAIASTNSTATSPDTPTSTLPSPYLRTAETYRSASQAIKSPSPIPNESYPPIHKPNHYL